MERESLEAKQVDDFKRIRDTPLEPMKFSDLYLALMFLSVCLTGSFVAFAMERAPAPEKRSPAIKAETRLKLLHLKKPPRMYPKSSQERMYGKMRRGSR